MIQEANMKTLTQTPPLDLGYDLIIDQDIYQVRVVLTTPIIIPRPRIACKRDTVVVVLVS